MCISDSYGRHEAFFTPAFYARVDGVMVDGRFRLMELEMIEPALFLAGRPEAAQRFAQLLQRRLERTPA